MQGLIPCTFLLFLPGCNDMRSTITVITISLFTVATELLSPLQVTAFPVQRIALICEKYG